MGRTAIERQLIAAKLWSLADGCLNEQDCQDAWQVLSRLGAPYRFSGKTADGRYEFLILHPDTGEVVATGRGETSALAMCEAALAGKKALFG